MPARSAGPAGRAAGPRRSAGRPRRRAAGDRRRRLACSRSPRMLSSAGVASGRLHVRGQLAVLVPGAVARPVGDQHHVRVGGAGRGAAAGPRRASGYPSARPGARPAPGRAQRAVHRSAGAGRVGQARRRPGVVLQHPQLAVVAAHQVQAGQESRRVLFQPARRRARGRRPTRSRAPGIAPALTIRPRHRRRPGTRSGPGPAGPGRADVAAHSAAPIRRGTGSRRKARSSPTPPKTTPSRSADRLTARSSAPQIAPGQLTEELPVELAGRIRRAQRLVGRRAGLVGERFGHPARLGVASRKSGNGLIEITAFPAEERRWRSMRRTSWSTPNRSRIIWMTRRSRIVEVNKNHALYAEAHIPGAIASTGRPTSRTTPGARSWTAGVFGVQSRRRRGADHTVTARRGRPRARPAAVHLLSSSTISRRRRLEPDPARPGTPGAAPAGRRRPARSPPSSSTRPGQPGGDDPALADTSPRKAARARARCMRPADVAVHSPRSITRGTGSTRNGRRATRHRR